MAKPKTFCEKAPDVQTVCYFRTKKQSVACSDQRSKSELTVKFSHSDKGIAFVTDHVIPAGNVLSCDWCVCHCKANTEKCSGMLVELKGRDFKHAVQQLDSTYSAMRRAWPELTVTQCIAVLSGRQIPSVKSSDYRIVGQYRLPGFQHFRARKNQTVEV